VTLRAVVRIHRSLGVVPLSSPLKREGRNTAQGYGKGLRCPGLRTATGMQHVPLQARTDLEKREGTVRQSIAGFAPGVLMLRTERHDHCCAEVGGVRQTTKAEYFREYAEYLRAIARHVRDDKRNTLLGMVAHFEELAKGAEAETRSIAQPSRRTSAPGHQSRQSPQGDEP
jgi:hypothetical protein